MRVAKFFHMNLPQLVLVGNGLDTIHVARLFRPGPLGIAEEVEVVAIPHVGTKFQVSIAQLELAVALPIQVPFPLRPEALPDRELWISVYQTSMVFMASGTLLRIACSTCSEDWTRANTPFITHRCVAASA